MSQEMDKLAKIDSYLVRRCVEDRDVGLPCLMRTQVALTETQRDELAALGVKIHSMIGNIATAIVPSTRETLSAINDLPYVAYLEASR